MLDFLNPIKGFGVTFHEMFRKVDTVQYPEERRPTAPRFHGHHQLNRWPDGLEKCIGCELCAWACPADAIYVEGRDNTVDGRYSPGERYGHVYQINYLRCILCGLCIEACPTRALTMTNEYDLADDSRENLIWTKEQLLAPLQVGMEAPPHPMRLGDDEKDYYLLGAAGIASTGDPVPASEAPLTAPADPGGQAAGEAAEVGGGETPLAAASSPPPPPDPTFIESRINLASPGAAPSGAAPSSAGGGGGQDAGLSGSSGQSEVGEQDIPPKAATWHADSGEER